MTQRLGVVLDSRFCFHASYWIEQMKALALHKELAKGAALVEILRRPGDSGRDEAKPSLPAVLTSEPDHGHDVALGDLSERLHAKRLACQWLPDSRYGNPKRARARARLTGRESR
jgi:hypothetical protein